MSKVYYGINELKKNQRRPTELEALRKNQTRFWGLEPIDPDILKEFYEEKQTEQNNKLRGDTNLLIYNTRINLKNKLNINKDVRKLKKFIKQLEKNKIDNKDQKYIDRFKRILHDIENKNIIVGHGHIDDLINSFKSKITNINNLEHYKPHKF